MKKNEAKITQDSIKVLDVLERKIIVEDTLFHVKSIFTGKRELNDALKNIIIRKIEKRSD